MSDSKIKLEQQSNPCGSFTKTIYEVTSHRNEIRSLSEVVVKEIETMGVESNFHQLELVLLEALTNALLYGNLEVPSKVRDTEGEDIFWQLVEERERDSNFGSRRIVLEVDCIREELRIKIRDEGAGFDWQNYLKSIDKGDVERYHDRGILLIQSYVDELDWNDKGNEITFSIGLGPKSIARREQENGAHTQED
jgi:anti-sigma regulatory factor (Ser/Thr protein kinase)